MMFTRKTIALWSLVCVALSACVTANAQSLDPKGDEYFASRYYERATERYLKVFHSKPANKANPPLLRRLAESILKSEMKRDTARYFIDLFLEFDKDDAEAYYMAALAHYHAHDFDVALQRLDSFRVRTETEEEVLMADRLNSWIRNGRRMLQDTLQNPIINLGEQINTKNSEINPYVLDGDQTLVFSCDDKYDRNAVINVYNIKWSEQTDLSWTPARKVAGSDVNTLYDEYPSGTTPTGMFFCSNREKEFKMYMADYKGSGRFVNTYEFKEPVDIKGSEVAGCLSPSGDTLYFSATAQNGKLDIFYSIRSMNGSWMTPRPIPGLVNRFDSDENYPYLAKGGTRLYFASDREGSMGGYDIFYSDFDFRRFEWGPAVQLPYPINDTYDNMTISFTENGRYAYVSLIRDDSYGGRDIYAVLYDHILPSSAIIRYEVRFRKKDRNTVDIDTQPRILITDTKGELVAIERVNLRTHSFLVVLDPGTYKMEIDCPGAQKYEEVIRVEERTYSPQPIEKKILLKEE